MRVTPLEELATEEATGWKPFATAGVAEWDTCIGCASLQGKERNQMLHFRRVFVLQAPVLLSLGEPRMRNTFQYFILDCMPTPHPPPPPPPPPPKELEFHLSRDSNEA